MVAKGINFAEQTNLYRRKKRRQQTARLLSLAGGFVLLALTVFGGTYFYKYLQERKLKNINAQIETERNSRDLEELTEMVDVTTRLKFIRKISQDQITWANFIEEMNSRMLPSVYISSFDGSASYTLEDNSANTTLAFRSATGAMPVETGASSVAPTVTLSVIAPSLTDIARQIIALEQSDKIESLSISDISLDDQGLGFSLELKINQSAIQRFSYAPRTEIIRATPIENPTLPAAPAEETVQSPLEITENPLEGEETAETGTELLDMDSQTSI